MALQRSGFNFKLLPVHLFDLFNFSLGGGGGWKGLQGKGRIVKIPQVFCEQVAGAKPAYPESKSVSHSQQYYVPNVLVYKAIGGTFVLITFAPEGSVLCQLWKRKNDCVMST